MNFRNESKFQFKGMTNKKKVHYFIELTVILFHNFMFHIIQLYTSESWHLSFISIFTSPEESFLWIYKQFLQQWSWWNTPNHTIGKKIVFLNNNTSLFYLNTSALILKHEIWNALCYLRVKFSLFLLLSFILSTSSQAVRKISYACYAILS